MFINLWPLAQNSILATTLQCTQCSTMPIPFSLDLRWRVTWMNLQLLSLSDGTIQRYVTLFRHTGDVKPLERSNGPQKLLSDFEQCNLLSLILQYPGIYLHEIQDKLKEAFGVTVSAAAICRTLQLMGCTRQVIRSNNLMPWEQSSWQRSLFYDPSMFLWLDESGCDRCNTLRKYGYSIRGTCPVDHRLLVRGTQYSALPVMSITGLHYLYLAEGTMNGDRFTHFMNTCLQPVLMPYDGMNPHSIMMPLSITWMRSYRKCRS